jgi:hypothetical protein
MRRPLRKIHKAPRQVRQPLLLQIGVPCGATAMAKKMLFDVMDKALHTRASEIMASNVDELMSDVPGENVTSHIRKL